MKSLEIERKFLIHTLPAQLETYPFYEIEQGYLCTEPVVRIRRQDDSYYLTYKSKGLMVREEYNLSLTKEAYEHLKAKIDGHLICKRRYKIPYQSYLPSTPKRPLACGSRIFFQKRCAFLYST